MNKSMAKQGTPRTDEEIIRESWHDMPISKIAKMLKKPLEPVLERATHMNRTAALRCLERKLGRTRGPKAITGWQRRQIKVLRKRTRLFGGQ